MKNREIIQFAADFQIPKKDAQNITITGYQLKNGLAAGHALKREKDGDFKYAAGWVIYHIATGLIASRPDDTQAPFKTPGQALNALRIKCRGRALLRIKQAAILKPIIKIDPESPEIIARLKAWPKDQAGKPKNGLENIKPHGNSALLALIAQIDAAIFEAPIKSDKFQEFKIGRSVYKVGARLDALRKFRANIIKNRTAFSDSALPVMIKAPAVPAIQPPARLKPVAAPKVQPAPKKPVKRLEYSLASWTPPAPDKITSLFSLHAIISEVKKRKPAGFMQYLSAANSRMDQLQA